MRQKMTIAWSRIVLVILVATTLATASPKKKTFDGTPDAVFDAAVKAAQQNWTVKFADRKTGTITFTTGTSVTNWGMECSMAIQQIAEGKVEVTLHTQKKMQIYAWNAGDRIADK